MTANEETFAAEAFAALGKGTTVERFTTRDAAFDAAAAYRVTSRVRRLREARGEIVRGRKIGFTNRTIWAEYGVYAPIWGYVYDRTIRQLDATPCGVLAGLTQPRIEPEIMFGFARAPAPDADEAALLDCVEWIAHGFEIVQSVFPDWKLTLADSIAAYGLHGALLVGAPQPVAGRKEELLAALPRFEIELSCEVSGKREVIDRGRGANVLDGPLSALRHFLAVLAKDPEAPALAAGEVVTTGTVTRAFPVAPGERWSTRVIGLDLPPATVTFA